MGGRTWLWQEQQLPQLHDDGARRRVEAPHRRQRPAAELRRARRGCWRLTRGGEGMKMPRRQRPRQRGTLRALAAAEGGEPWRCLRLEGSFARCPHGGEGGCERRGGAAARCSRAANGAAAAVTSRRRQGGGAARPLVTGRVLGEWLGWLWRWWYRGDGRG